MRKRVFQKLKQNTAFTLMETLIVVAIMVILMGISIFGFYEFSVATKMTELDSYAKTIYLEAQNQFTAKKMEGSNQKFYKEMKDNYPNRFLGTLDKMPADYDQEKNKDAWKELSYITKVDDITKELIFVEAETYEVNYVIEVSALTGDVYGVFCWYPDEDIETNQAYYESYYEDVIAELENRDKSTRKQQLLGYYGGDLVATKSTSDFELNQKVEIINEEELYLKVSFKHSGVLERNLDKLEIKCVITGENGVQKECILESPKTKGSRMETFLLLDSMESGFDFASITQNDNFSGEGTFLLGENVTISVISKFKHDKYFCKEESPNYEVSTSFGEKNISDEKITVDISALRHLRNLGNHWTTDAVFVIQQTDDIDFDTKDFAWVKNERDIMEYVGKQEGDRPAEIVRWKPLENDTLFWNSGSSNDKTVVEGANGNNYVLKNFVVNSSEGDAGIFARASHVEFKNIKIENIQVNASGQSNAGALVGNISNSTVDNCGVYLATYTRETGAKKYYSQNTNVDGYANEMDMRYDTYKITGNENVGGLFGLATNSQIKGCYAAVKVEGGKHVGGFIGTAVSTTVKDSYASGDVVGKTDAAGGFFGAATSGTKVTNAYAAGDIFANTTVGGFLGYSDSCTYRDCYSYGEVLNVAGEKPSSGGSYGGFISTQGNANNTFDTCKYLSQKGYNVQGNFNEPSEMYKSYSELADMAKEIGSLSAGASYPYSDSLMYGAFPFSRVLEHHYGDWPLQYTINNALVYYEKYEDGYYGYYSVTQMASAEGELGADGYIWVLDTLRDTECIEDGYALLSMYNLTQFDYQLMIGSAETNTKGQSTVQEGELTVKDSESEAGPSNAIKLRQQGGLQFRAYDANALALGAKETLQEHDYSNDTIKDYMVATGMYLYQLPYELQSTHRYNVSNFYDKLIIYNGYAKGNDETPVVGGGEVSTGINFFYCPHFAKTAINPGLDVEGQHTSTTLLKNPSTVAVRSARHLNALGRFPYFWNDTGGMDSEITYEQEVDVNFGTYAVNASGDRIYCGHSFDLTNTSAENKDGNGNEIRNIPIGMPDLDDTYKQFKNTYDGMCNQIIDYRVESTLPFVGLFGEIRDADLKNIVMTVSEEGAGYVRSKALRREGESSERAGVGALVGLAYMYDNKITNCASAGYDVEYYIFKDTSRPKENHIGRIAVGGLVGYNMSYIGNCMAANNVILELQKTGDNDSVFIAGLAGSHMYGTLENSYSGGKIEINNNGNGDVKYLSVGGVTAGGLFIADDNFGFNTKFANYFLGIQTSLTDLGKKCDGVAWRNLYSYTELAVGTNTSSDNTVVTTTISRLVRNPNWNTDNRTVVGNESEGYNSYYLDSVTDAIPDAISVSGYSKGTSYDYAALTGLNANSFTTRVTDAAHSYNVDPTLDGLVYPFPTFITGKDGQPVHYGDWPILEVAKEEITANYPAYFENYEDGSAGIYYVDENGNGILKNVTAEGVTQDGLINDKNITDTGYGVLTAIADNTKTPVVALNINGYTYYMYEQQLAANPNNSTCVEMQFTYETFSAIKDTKTIVEMVNQVSKTLYVNENFGAAISPAVLGVSTNPLQTRTQEHLMNVSQVIGDGVHMLQSHDIPLNEEFVSVSVKEGHVYNGGATEGCVISGAEKTVFASNAGTIMNTNVVNSKVDTVGVAVGFVVKNSGTISSCGVYGETAYTDMLVSGNEAYGFVKTNTGTITHSFVTGTVTGTQKAAGFAGENSGTISQCYANANVSATADDAVATGFLYKSNNAAKEYEISLCYVLGELNAPTTYGFMYFGDANMCYTISKNLGTTAYAFAGIIEATAETEKQVSKATDCYYVYDEASNFNTAVTENGIGTKYAMSDAAKAGDFAPPADTENDARPYNTALGTNYPYPSIGLIHVGDWPYGGYPLHTETGSTVDVQELNHPEISRGDADFSYYAGLFYYEIYEDGTVGMYAKGIRYTETNGKTVIASLSADKTIVERGLGVFYYNGEYEITDEMDPTGIIPNGVREDDWQISSAYASRKGLASLVDVETYTEELNVIGICNNCGYTYEGYICEHYGKEEEIRSQYVFYKMKQFSADTVSGACFEDSDGEEPNAFIRYLSGNGGTKFDIIIDADDIEDARN